MNKKYILSLFIFRRDLRIQDNTAFIAAMSSSKLVIPIFIIDSRQVSDKNSYRSAHAIQFMIESLLVLEKLIKEYHGKLYIMHGVAEEVVDKLLELYPIRAVFINKDYTPFSQKRDAAIKDRCYKHGVAFEQFDDVLLNPPEKIVTSQNTIYEKFTPYFRKASLIPVQKPQPISLINFYTEALADATTDIERVYKETVTEFTKIAYSGGRDRALTILKNIDIYKNYGHNHNLLSYKTTGLSAHLKFGTVSVREVYESIVKTFDRNHPLIKQLYWRDFFTYIAYHSPRVFGHAYHEQYNNIAWDNNSAYFKTWCDGLTGFPIVDAGMRQLNQTGFMHNRARLITASFLTKDLHINWQWGECYFACHLTDYDPSINNGNWQWVASTGCDSQPYFRIFNPWIQQKKFDPQCEYIKKWVPELQNVSVQDIHKWYKQNALYKNNYPEPIIDHAVQAKKARLLYKI